MSTPKLRGRLAFPIEADARFQHACLLAGALAEAGVQMIRLQDPRACHARELLARETNLPKLLAESPPGTILRALGPDGSELGLCIDAEWIEYAGEGAAAQSIDTLSRRLNPPG